MNSILTQTYPSIELILVDDGSKDSSPAICDDFAKKDARVRVIHKENGGAGLARNAGLDIARGELIATVDSDDYIMPDMYMKLYGLMRDNDADMAMCGYLSGKEPGNNIERVRKAAKIDVITSEQALYRLVILGGFPVYLWNKLYRSELFDGIRFPPGNRGDDTTRMHRLIGAGRKIAITHENLYFYRIHDEIVRPERALLKAVIGTAA